MPVLKTLAVRDLAAAVMWDYTVQVRTLSKLGDYLSHYYDHISQDTAGRGSLALVDNFVVSSKGSCH